jgi:phenylalanyl-tRNA synthetase beta chain
MRTTLLGSLLGVARRNLARGAPAVALHESARIYRKDGRRDENVDIADGIGPSAGVFAGEREAPVREAHHLAALAVGPLVAKSWRGGGEPADFFAFKGVLEALAGQLGVALEFVAESEPFLHPGRSARVLVAGAPAGWIGEVHPLVCREWDLDAAVAFEVELAALVGAATAGEEEFEDVTAFPAVYQDLAVVVPDDVTAAGVRAAVLGGGDELLRVARVFDLYEGEQLSTGHKSLALRLEFRAPDRTLTDEEVAGARAAIEAGLEKIGGTLRA